MSQQQDADRLYREGVAAIRVGDKATAREKLMEAIRINQMHEQAWLWLSAAVDTDEERITCLENVLTINPHNEAARRGLVSLGQPVPEPPAPSPVPSQHMSIDQSARPSPSSVPDTSAGGAAGDDPPRLLVHSESRVSEMMSQPQGKQNDMDESWRDGLYTPEALAEQGSFASLVRVEPVVKRSLLDLFNVWGTMLFFNVGGGFREEARHGSFWHIIANVIGGSLLQATGVIVFFVVLLAFMAGNSQPPLFRSIIEMAGQQPPEATAELNALLAEFRLMGAAPLFVGLLIYAVVSIPVLFVVQMFRGLVIDFVAGNLKGRGDIMQTLHAITIALVVAQIVQLPMMFLFPLLPLSVVIVIGLAFRLYQFLIEAVAVGEVHRFGIFLSMGVLIISAAILGALGGGLMCLFSFLGALPSGGG